MRIVCPICAAAYDVPPALLQPAGRLVRCARCGEEWSPGAKPVDMPAFRWPESERETAPPDLRAAEMPLAVTAPLAAASHRPPAAAAADARARRAAVAGWIATLVVLGAAGYVAYAWRADIQRAWPASQRAYAMLGVV